MSYFTVHFDDSNLESNILTKCEKGQSLVTLSKPGATVMAPNDTNS